MTCMQCGAFLQSRYLNDEEQEIQEQGKGLNEEEQGLKLLRCESLDWIKSLAEKLDEKNISYQVKSLFFHDGNKGEYGHTSRCEIYVKSEDWSNAQEIDKLCYLEQVPDANPDQINGNQDLEHCPACGGLLSAEASSCPGCGLEFQMPADETDEDDSDS